MAIGTRPREGGHRLIGPADGTRGETLSFVTRVNVTAADSHVRCRGAVVPGICGSEATTFLSEPDT